MHSPIDMVIMVHGLWMHPIVMYRLKHYLTHQGFQVKSFHYPSIRHSMADNVKKLHTMLRSIENETIHFVGHSLGGLVIRRLFHDFPIQKIGRIVTLGTPHQGSQVAKKLANFTMGRWLLGQSVHAGLLGNIPNWQGQRELGNLVGTTSFGFGQLITTLPKPHDGTVSVVECQLANVTDYVTLPVTHTSLLFSTQVAQQVTTFLHTGHFFHD